MLKRILERSRYLVVVGVVSLLLASLAAFCWGAFKTWHVLEILIESRGTDPQAAIHLVELMDSFLVATALLIFAHGIYELFIEPVEQPKWLVIHTLHDLKVKLASVIVLLISVNFLSRLVEQRDGRETLYFGLAAAVVSGVLIAFSRFGEKD